MESTSSRNTQLALHTLKQLVDACSLVITWNKSTHGVEDYVTSPEGMEKMAASCMLIESIGEGIKKIDKILPGFLETTAPEVPWKNIKGLRDHIAHGYFNLDADIIYDVAVNEIPELKIKLEEIIGILKRHND